MKTQLLFLLALAPVMLDAQVVLYSLNGITPAPLGAVYGYGQVAAGDSMIVRFRALNTGTASVTVTCLAIKNTTGAGFAIVNSSSTPFVVAAGQPMDFFVGFSATAITSYSATVQVGTGTATDACGGTIESAILLATVVPAPILSVAAPCTGPDTNRNISFGRITQGIQESCTFSIQNPFPQALTVSPLLLTGAAFTTTSGNAVTIAAGQSVSFAIQFSPATGSAFSGTLTVGTRTYTLVGTGFSPPLSSLVWSFDSTKIGSGEQHALSLQLSAPATVTAAGTMTLTFNPSIKTVADDA
ncbi:MAG: choice-of-anchor D domain-containing protein, partial [Acidobacteriota bacterium]